MIVLIGESCGGKTTVQNLLIEKYGMKKLVTYTDRSPREGEVDGVDYHFISKEEFLQKKEEDFFQETDTYRGFDYGSSIEGMSREELQNTVAVLTPEGITGLGTGGFVVWISSSMEIRALRLRERGLPMEEVENQLVRDSLVFSDLEYSDCVDKVLFNSSSNIEGAEFIADYIWSAYNRGD